MARSSLKTRGANLLARWPRCWNGASAARPCSTSTDPAPPESRHPWPVSESPGGLHGANHGPGLRGSARPIVSSIKSSYPKEAKDMRRIRTRSWLLGAVAAAALAATGGGSAASAKTVNGAVGPGFTRVLTGVEFTGTKSFVLRLRKGSYRFQCDPHAGIMHGRFLVS